MLFVLLGAYLLCALGWLAQNVGEVPTYGDTLDYLGHSQTLEVNSFRGFAYPAFLALIDARDPGRMLAAWRSLTKQTHTSATLTAVAPGFLVVQLVQLAVYAASLAYFLRVFARDAGGSRAGGLVLFLLLFTDPLLAHFQLAVMTDGLALSTSLVACAAFVRLASSRARRPGTGLVLCLSVFLVTGLRVEKGWVMAGVALVSLACWTLRARRRRDAAGMPDAYPHALLASVLVLVAAGAGLGVQRGLGGEDRNWPIRDRVLNQRVVYPHLAEDYERLPEAVRARVSREQAETHGESVLAASRVIDEAAGGDARVRRELVAAAAAVALRLHGPRIALDVARDSLENVAATPAFYTHLAVLLFAGEASFQRLFPADVTRWTYTRMAQQHPGTTRLFVVASGIVLLLGAAAALAGGWAARRASRGAWSDGVPIGAYVLLNALAFALVADVITVRYTLLAHAALLLLVYRGGLRWLDRRG